MLLDQPTGTNAWNPQTEIASMMNLGSSLGYGQSQNSGAAPWPPTQHGDPSAFLAQQAMAQAAMQTLAATGGNLSFQRPAETPAPAPNDPFAASTQQLAFAALLSQMQAGMAASGGMPGASSQVPSYHDQIMQMQLMSSASASNPWAMMLAASAAQAGGQQPASAMWPSQQAVWPTTSQQQVQQAAWASQQLLQQAAWPTPSQPAVQQPQFPNVAIESAHVDQSSGPASETEAGSDGEEELGSQGRRRDLPWDAPLPREPEAADEREQAGDGACAAAQQEAREEAANDDNASSHQSHEQDHPSSSKQQAAAPAAPVGSKRQHEEQQPGAPAQAPKHWEQPAAQPTTSTHSKPWEQPAVIGASAWGKPWTEPSQAAPPETRTSMPPPPPRPHTCDGSHGAAPQPSDYVRGVLGPQRWASVRATLLKQQQAFVQQLFELHKLSHLQKLLCSEVLGYEPQAPSSSQGEPAPALGLRRHGAGAGPVWRLMPGASSAMSLPSVGTPSTRDIALPSGPAAGESEPQPPMGSQQRLQNDLAQLVNIPRPLRSKAGSVSPEQSQHTASVRSGDRPATTAPRADALLPFQREARQRPGVLRPQATRLGQPAGVDGSASQISISVGQLPSAAGTGTGVGINKRTQSGTPQCDRQVSPMSIEPATAVSTKAPIAVGIEPANAPSAKAPMAPPALPAPLAASLGRDLMIEAAAALLQSSGGLAPPVGTAPPSSLLMAPPPSMPPLLAPLHIMGLQLMMEPNRPPPANEHMDPHAAWFARHYGAQAAAAPNSQPPPNGTGGGSGMQASGQSGANMGGAPAGRWWQDEAATFGDVPPSAAPAASLSGGAAQAGTKRTVSKQAQTGSAATTKKGRHDDQAGAAAQNPSAFKAFHPRKARSQRGSNRMGSNRADHSSDSGMSGSSFNEGGSCIAGSGGGGSAKAARRTASSSLLKPASTGGHITTAAAPLAAHPGGERTITGWEVAMPGGGVAGVMGGWEVAGRAGNGIASPRESLPGNGAGSVEQAGSAGPAGSAGGEDKSAAGILLSLSIGGAAAAAAVVLHSPPRLTSSPPKQAAFS